MVCVFFTPWQYLHLTTVTESLSLLLSQCYWQKEAGAFRYIVVNTDDDNE